MRIKEKLDRGIKKAETDLKADPQNQAINEIVKKRYRLDEELDEANKKLLQSEPGKRLSLLKSLKDSSRTMTNVYHDRITVLGVAAAILSGAVFFKETMLPNGRLAELQKFSPEFTTALIASIAIPVAIGGFTAYRFGRLKSEKFIEQEAIRQKIAL